MRLQFFVAAGIAVFTLLCPGGARAGADAVPPRPTVVLDTLHVIATRLPVAANRMPGAVTVVEGEELRRRGAEDLRSALALAAGVEAVPGGDAGPAGAVPALWGLREFDAFLLVVDGVPWGGAFIPDLPTLDLHDVARIEVMRGPAPVTYGATSFVGVIHVIHNLPGAKRRAVEVGGGSYGTLRVSGASDLGGFGRIAVDGARERFADEDAGVDRAHARYRVELPGGLRVDTDLSRVDQSPNSPHPRSGSVLDPAIPLDANHNPADAKLDRTRLHVAATQSTSWMDWTAALSRVDDEIVRGFLAEGATDDGSTPNANGYAQDREFTELYAELHRRLDPADELGLVFGADLIFGEGREQSRNFSYYSALDGGARQSSGEGTTVENTEFEAERTFAGLFGEADFHPWPRWTFLAGLRLNLVDEKREGEAEDPTGNEIPRTVESEDSHLGARAGVSWEAWRDGPDRLAVHADYRDTFKPAAIDFGPEAEVDPLDPETARSVEIGVRTELAGGRVELGASAFRMDFENLVVATTDGGRPALTNAGTERFDGVELEAGLDLGDHWHALGTWAWHDARFRDYVRDFDGVPTDLGGNSLELSPEHLASAGLAWTGGQVDCEVIANYVGDRYLDQRNRALAEASVTLDASARLRISPVELRLAGQNLTDRRDPVAESELGEAQYYRMPARRIELSATLHLP